MNTSRNFGIAILLLGLSPYSLNAGIVVSMITTAVGPFDFADPASLGPFDVHIFLSQDPPGNPIAIRLLRFDTSRTSPQISLPSQITFRPLVTSNPHHSLFRNLPLPNAVYLPNDYTNRDPYDPDFSEIENGLYPWKSNMMVIPTSGVYRVASLYGVRIRNGSGDLIVLDVMNFDAADSQYGGAQIT